MRPDPAPIAYGFVAADGAEEVRCAGCWHPDHESPRYAELDARDVLRIEADRGETVRCATCHRPVRPDATVAYELPDGTRFCAACYKDQREDYELRDGEYVECGGGRRLTADEIDEDEACARCGTPLHGLAE